MNGATIIFTIHLYKNCLLTIIFTHLHAHASTSYIVAQCLLQRVLVYYIFPLICDIIVGNFACNLQEVGWHRDALNMHDAWFRIYLNADQKVFFEYNANVLCNVILWICSFYDAFALEATPNRIQCITQSVFWYE